MTMNHRPLIAILGLFAALINPIKCSFAAEPPPSFFDVRSFGATGDGVTLDTDAINNAIETAAGKGGGTVYFPAGTYLSFSIHLKSHITLYLDSGATLLAADPADGKGRYDAPEANAWDMFQDFGHSHWQNSLIWGIGLENITIAGPGRIDGLGLSRRSPGPRRPTQAGDTPLSLVGDAEGAAIAVNPGGESAAGRGDQGMDGLGTKAIALKECRHVILRDITIFRGGHFALLATGVDDLTIDNVKVDTNRDGFDIDSCRNVRISNCTVNSPNDDAIVLKSSYGLGRAQATENVTITNCQVSGFDLGTMLDGTYQRTQEMAPDREGVCGRIKFGTESNGGFKNITISNCLFDHCRGLALETVDGGWLEDVVISNITMRDIVNAPIFLRLGSRMRGPEGTPVGRLRRVSISNINIINADSDYASIIAGIPGHPIEDIRLSNIRIHCKGGGTVEQAARELPENANAYPEPSIFGITSSHGFFLRHIEGIQMSNIEISHEEEDFRPPFILENVVDARFDGIAVYPAVDVPSMRLKNVKDFKASRSEPFADQVFDTIDSTTF